MLCRRKPLVARAKVWVGAPAKPGPRICCCPYYLNCKVAVLFASNIVYQGLPSGATVRSSRVLGCLVLSVYTYEKAGAPKDLGQE